MELTDLDHKNFNSHVGKTFYILCPDDNNYYRTVHIKRNPFTNSYNLSSPIQFMVPKGFRNTCYTSFNAPTTFPYPTYECFLEMKYYYDGLTETYHQICKARTQKTKINLKEYGGYRRTATGHQ
jgi:hypothetical protein